MCMCVYLCVCTHAQGWLRVPHKSTTSACRPEPKTISPIPWQGVAETTWSRLQYHNEIKKTWQINLLLHYTYNSQKPCRTMNWLHVHCSWCLGDDLHDVRPRSDVREVSLSTFELFGQAGEQRTNSNAFVLPIIYTGCPCARGILLILLRRKLFDQSEVKFKASNKEHMTEFNKFPKGS